MALLQQLCNLREVSSPLSVVQHAETMPAAHVAPGAVHLHPCRHAMLGGDKSGTRIALSTCSEPKRELQHRLGCVPCGRAGTQDRSKESNEWQGTRLAYYSWMYQVDRAAVTSRTGVGAICYHLNGRVFSVFAEMSCDLRYPGAAVNSSIHHPGTNGLGLDSCGRRFWNLVQSCLWRETTVLAGESDFACSTDTD